MMKWSKIYVQNRIDRFITKNINDCNKKLVLRYQNALTYNINGVTLILKRYHLCV